MVGTLLGIPEVAKRLGMSERWVAAMCRSKQLHAVKIGKKWKISEADLQRFIEKKEYPLAIG